MVGVVTRASIIFGPWGFGILSRFGRVACSEVFPQTRLKREVDILTDPLGVMERIKRLCLEKLDMINHGWKIGQQLWHEVHHTVSDTELYSVGMWPQTPADPRWTIIVESMGWPTVPRPDMPNIKYNSWLQTNNAWSVVAGQPVRQSVCFLTVKVDGFVGRSNILPRCGRHMMFRLDKTY